MVFFSGILKALSLSYILHRAGIKCLSLRFIYLFILKVALHKERGEFSICSVSRWPRPRWPISTEGAGVRGFGHLLFYLAHQKRDCKWSCSDLIKALHLLSHSSVPKCQIFCVTTMSYFVCPSSLGIR